MITLYLSCDGACLPTNPGGVATWAFIAEHDGTVVEQQWGVACEGDTATNNVAEYAAVFHALTWATTAKITTDRIILSSDSQLVIRQLDGQYRVTKPALIEWWQRCKAIEYALVPVVHYRWIPRDQNADADALTHRAYQEHQHRTNPSP